MAEIGIRDIRTYLCSKSPGELIDEVILLTKTFPKVKYYQVKLSPKGESQAFERYKKIIRDEFFPARGFGKLRLTNIRRAISDYKRMSDSPERRVELLLYFVEQGAEFISEYGDINENFYESMESAYEKACKLVTSRGSQKKWKDRFHEMVRATDGTGYGFGDSIISIFEEYFGATE